MQSSPLLLTKAGGRGRALAALFIVSISQLALTNTHAALVAVFQGDPATSLFSNEPTTTTTTTTTTSAANGTAAELGGAVDSAEGGLLGLTVPSSIRPNEDPENTRDIVQKARTNQFSAEMVTNRTRAMVSCESGEILVRLNFSEPFRGVGYADFDRASPCRFEGKGDKYYEMRLPLRGCGTKQEKPKLFINNIVLRFHRSLELEEDEAKTIVCRYPPPQAPEPPPVPGPPARVIQAPPEPARLTQYEPFVLIAGLLFFALLLAGVGTTSYVTRQQKITEINTPLPIASTTEHDTYLDNHSIVTTEDITTVQKIMTLPKYSTHTVEDVFTTKIHEIDTEENLVYHKRHLPPPPPRAQLEHQNYDDTYITNQDEIECEETLAHSRLGNQRQLGHEAYDDAYLTNQDEIEQDERLTHHKMRLESEPKLEVRIIEDTFLTNVDEIVEKVDTTYHKSHSSAGHDLDRLGGGLEHRELEHRGFEHGQRGQQQHYRHRQLTPPPPPTHRAEEHFEEFESRLESLRRQ